MGGTQKKTSLNFQIRLDSIQNENFLKISCMRAKKFPHALCEHKALPKKFPSTLENPKKLFIVVIFNFVN